MINNLKFEENVQEALENLSNSTKTPVSSIIEEALASRLNVITHERKLNDAKRNFEKFLVNQSYSVQTNNQRNLKLAKYYNNDNKACLVSSPIIYTLNSGNSYTGYIMIHHTDGRSSVCLRFNSIAKELRTYLSSLQTNNNPKITNGAKFTSYGFETRKKEEIKNLTANDIYTMLVDLYNII